MGSPLRAVASDVNVDSTRTVGIIGTGKVGTTLARLAAAHGWRALLTGSARQPMQALIVASLVPEAELVSFDQLIAASDLVIVAIPYAKADSIDWSALSGQVVVDAMNYWYPVDGHLPEVETASDSTAELTAARNPEMRLVKSLNHLGYHDMETDSRAAGDPMRRAVVAASNDLQARELVAQFIDSIGFDPVLAGMSDGVLLEPEGPVFGQALTRAEMISILDEAAARPVATPWLRQPSDQSVA